MSVNRKFGPTDDTDFTVTVGRTLTPVGLVVGLNMGNGSYGWKGLGRRIRWKEVRKGRNGAEDLSASNGSRHKLTVRRCQARNGVTHKLNVKNGMGISRAVLARKRWNEQRIFLQANKVRGKAWTHSLQKWGKVVEWFECEE